MTPSDIEQFRPGFEAWARKEEPDWSLSGSSIAGQGWYYHDDVENDFWLCWIAAKLEASTEPSAGLAAELRSAARLIRQDLKLRQGMAAWTDSEQAAACDAAATIIEQLAIAQKDEPSSTSTSHGAPTDHEIYEIAEKNDAVVVCTGEGDYNDNCESVINFGRALLAKYGGAAPGDALDAERYRAIRYLMQTAKGSASIEVNQHLAYYETCEPGKEVRLQWYPDTPIGFYTIEASTFDEMADEAIATSTSKREEGG